MKKFISMFLISFLLLTGCESEKEIDRLVSDYAKTELGVKNIEVIYRSGIDESNMGERSYLVRSKDEPKVEFSVYLEGILKTKVVTDDYKQQLQAYQVGQSFLKENIEMLNNLGFTINQFSNTMHHEYSTARELKVDVNTNRTISLNDTKSIEDMYTLVEMLNYLNETITEDDFLVSSLVVDYPFYSDHESLMFHDNVNQLVTFEEFYSFLISKPSLINQALFETNYNSWQALGEQVNALGFKYAEGMNLQSISCYEQDLEGLECTGGYNIRLHGEDKSEENLERLKERLRGSDLHIQRVVVPNTGGAIEVIL
jgi:hypothetical protein